MCFRLPAVQAFIRSCAALLSIPTLASFRRSGKNLFQFILLFLTFRTVHVTSVKAIKRNHFSLYGVSKVLIYMKEDLASLKQKI